MEYAIHHQGAYTADQIVIEILTGKKQYPSQIRELISAAWQNARLQPDLHIFNGKVASLCGYETGENTLRVSVQETDYKSFYGTNVKNVHQIHHPEHLANAVAACAVVETTDATILVGKRGSQMAEGSELWHIPGGTLEFPKSLKTQKELIRSLGLPLHKSSALNPVLTMVRELKEEFNLSPEDIPHRLCLGLGENLQMKKPEFLCYFRLNLSSIEVKSRMATAIDADEHSQISFVPVEEILDFTTMYPFAPIGKAAIQVYWDFISKLYNTSGKTL
jgi:8-oxo-dGTP pyrophosphatase MutT (NUDIX family)